MIAAKRNAARRFRGGLAGPAVACLGWLAVACGSRDVGTVVVLGATTSTYDSGFIEYVVARFNSEFPGVQVRTVIAGSGEALALGERGDVDLLLVHTPDAEEHFVAEGHAPGRYPFVRNSFVLAGPPDDPAGIADAGSPSTALARIAAGNHLFVSRGDSSGTHIREILLWEGAGIEPGSWAGYIESGQGQATTLHLASQRSGYVLAEEATYEVLGDRLELTVYFQGGAALDNVYSILEPVSATRRQAARVLAEWLLSEGGRDAVEEFPVNDSGGPIFTPCPSDLEMGHPNVSPC